MPVMMRPLALSHDFSPEFGVETRATPLQMRMPFKGAPAQGLTFIDLFAGIGGLRQAFERQGAQCVFTSEWNKFSQQTYRANFGQAHPLYGDITQVDEKTIPDHDILLAGFPCQPFSLAGVSKKNSLGRAHGFADETQGTLFFDVARILAAKTPAAFLLENVKNLKSHDKGRTFDVIMRTLEGLGYQVHTKIINGQSWTPQNRERVAIVGFKQPNDFSWDNLEIPKQACLTIGDILHKADGTEPYLEHDGSKYFDHQKRRALAKYTLSDKLWQYLQDYAAKHREKGNGFGFGLVYPDKPDCIARTLSARYYKDGSEILVYQGENQNPRKLTPRECARLMGFPDSFVIPVSDTQAYKQFGNSVVMPAFSAVALAVTPWIKSRG
jgi:DNA (cytosine-5)-methyltransferase 1